MAMPKRLLLLLLVAGLSCVLVRSTGSAPGALAASSQQLELALKADRDSYRLSDTLHLETRVTNVGQSDVYIWEWDMCWNLARGLTMRIVDAQGKDVQGRVLLDCVPPPPRQKDVYQFFKLAQGDFHGRAEAFALSDLVNGPGDYDISATFSGSLSSKWIAEFLGRDPIAKLPLWTMDKPRLASNRVHITVK
jgi:hypothetical protein